MCAASTPSISSRESDSMKTLRSARETYATGVSESGAEIRTASSAHGSKTGREMTRSAAGGPFIFSLDLLEVTSDDGESWSCEPDRGQVAEKNTTVVRLCQRLPPWVDPTAPTMPIAGVEGKPYAALWLPFAYPLPTRCLPFGRCRVIASGEERHYTFARI